ncbi:hypothetical protein EVAR_85762_1 [Eumeta japonica]|uniref:Uncharacterized protein n=1 Tax=Eumeta variegata TaxID=151549 RepID=A0A4C1ZI87_EUMVA|nr:hypothetical protein EVAR_85762_1 [Eumeta japonica]
MRLVHCFTLTHLAKLHIRDSSNTLGIGSTSVYKILHDGLKKPDKCEANSPTEGSVQICRPRRAEHPRAVIANLSHAKATAGSHKDSPTNNAPNNTSTEDIKALISVTTSIDIGEVALLAKKFKAATNPVEKICLLAEQAPLVIALKKNIARIPFLARLSRPLRCRCASGRTNTGTGFCHDRCRPAPLPLRSSFASRPRPYIYRIFRKSRSPAGGGTRVGRTMEGVIHPRLYKPEQFRKELSDRVQRPTENPKKKGSSPLRRFSSCERGGEGGEKPIMGRPCAWAYKCVRFSQTKNLLNNLGLQWRKQNAVTPTSQTRPFRHGDGVGA